MWLLGNLLGKLLGNLSYPVTFWDYLVKRFVFIGFWRVRGSPTPFRKNFHGFHWFFIDFVRFQGSRASLSDFLWFCVILPWKWREIWMLVRSYPKSRKIAILAYVTKACAYVWGSWSKPAKIPGFVQIHDFMRFRMILVDLAWFSLGFSVSVTL